MWISYFFNKIYPNVRVINFQGSTLYTKVINLIPIVVLTPIIIQALMFDKSGEIINSISFEIVCGVLAVLISILFKNVMITILLTMMFFLILTNIPFFNG